MVSTVDGNVKIKTAPPGDGILGSFGEGAS